MPWKKHSALSPSRTKTHKLQCWQHCVGLRRLLLADCSCFRASGISESPQPSLPLAGLELRHWAAFFFDAVGCGLVMIGGNGCPGFPSLPPILGPAFAVARASPLRIFPAAESSSTGRLTSLIVLVTFGAAIYGAALHALGVAKLGEIVAGMRART